MFQSAATFDQNLAAWNVASVSNMAWMFQRTAAWNQNIAAWNVAKVANMDGMFYMAAAFDQNLAGWNVLSVTSMLSASPPTVARSSLLRPHGRIAVPRRRRRPPLSRLRLPRPAGTLQPLAQSGIRTRNVPPTELGRSYWQTSSASTPS